MCALESIARVYRLIIVSPTRTAHKFPVKRREKIQVPSPPPPHPPDVIRNLCGPRSSAFRSNDTGPWIFGRWRRRRLPPWLRALSTMINDRRTGNRARDGPADPVSAPCRKGGVDGTATSPSTRPQCRWSATRPFSRSVRLRGRRRGCFLARPSFRQIAAESAACRVRARTVSRENTISRNSRNSRGTRFPFRRDYIARARGQKNSTSEKSLIPSGAQSSTREGRTEWKILNV